MDDFAIQTTQKKRIDSCWDMECLLPELKDHNII